jgi:hypothetical protein
MTARPDDVIAEMMHYLRDFVEVPHPVFSDLPVCPFARKARLDNKILFRVQSLVESCLVSPSDFMALMAAFSRDRTHDILLVIHPEKNTLSVDGMEQFVAALNRHLAPLQLVGFGGHPQDSFQIQGVHTRRSPYPHLSIQSTPYLEKVTPPLRKTAYYRHWTPEDLAAVGFYERC